MSAYSFKKAASRLVVGLMIVQFIPLDRINPPETSPVKAPVKITAILEKSCFDCHSFRTKWSAPAYIAPASWAASAMVSGGRRALNFSEWDNANTTIAVHRMRAVRKTVLEGSGHQPLYYGLYPQSRMSTEERTLLLNWIDSYDRKQLTGFKNSGSTLRDKSF
ncbi:heme-binding domain-containing protein [Chlorobium sp.]|jgi:hypothetical protein|uniref:heme-binding domain-containing protein n=1 Tax=Chlorobium sp. TaxID=1095 RepID=UPI003C4FB28B|nr:heme-binding domain-containing protein [Chlorobiaceae bacterium]